MAEFCDWLLEEGYALRFIPNELLMDNLTIDDILDRLVHGRALESHIFRPAIKDYNDVFRHLSQCDYVIACRFHGLLFSFLSKVPAIALAHHSKFIRLAEEMGQGQFVRKIDAFQLDDLKCLFGDLVNHRETVAKEISDNSARYAELVEDQYRRMGQMVAKPSKQ